MIKRVGLILIYVGSVVSAYFYGVSSVEKTDPVLQEKLLAQNKLLKNQLNYFQKTLLEKDKEYLSLTQQLIELDKKFSQQQEHEDRFYAELNQLAQQNPPAAQSSTLESILATDILDETEVIVDENLRQDSSLAGTDFEMGEEESTPVNEINSETLTAMDSQSVDNESIRTSAEHQLSLSPRRKMPPSVFRTAMDVDLINDNYQILTTWKQGRSFTAKEKFGKYYKVSGYFVDRKWTGAQELWLIPIDKTIRR